MNWAQAINAAARTRLLLLLIWTFSHTLGIKRRGHSFRGLAHFTSYDLTFSNQLLPLAPPLYIKAAPDFIDRLLVGSKLFGISANQDDVAVDAAGLRALVNLFSHRIY